MQYLGADNCAGQNINYCVVWFLQDLIRKGVSSIIAACMHAHAVYIYIHAI